MPLGSRWCVRAGYCNKAVRDPSRCIRLYRASGSGARGPGINHAADQDRGRHRPQAFPTDFWQMAIGAVVMTLVAIWRGTRLPLGRYEMLVYVFIAFIGFVLPNTASYQVAVHLPSGVMSILLSMIRI